MTRRPARRSVHRLTVEVIVQGPAAENLRRLRRADQVLMVSAEAVGISTFSECRSRFEILKGRGWRTLRDRMERSAVR